MKKILIILGLTIYTWCGIKAQVNQDRVWHFGPEVQQYPTGFLFNLHLSKYVSSRFAVESRVGYNLVRHGDAGVHDDERGGGWGGSIGAHRILGTPGREENQGWIIGGRCDLWFNKIDWKDRMAMSNEIKGKTEAIVLQPTAFAGYQILLHDRLFLTPTIALGAEINIRESGGEVGEGLILLWGIRFLYGW